MEITTATTTKQQQPEERRSGDPIWNDYFLLLPKHFVRSKEWKKRPSPREIIK